eukprot:CAMPEP_0179120464 /NCGR_PEP_ID=MMETSP0796-20121207/56757_1 /TAXON_ID=73915 /ORGANISM="Pyrodinium bahamense, Strain pbaha01" /LENGTH=47 /DNA_ID= /DNA_START= /DNA_END= /DNA_ORIENTATION=
MSAGSHPGLTGAPVAVNQTVYGDFIRGKADSRASKNLFRTGLIMHVR